jgi:hypothetical protein
MGRTLETALAVTGLGDVAGGFGEDIEMDYCFRIFRSWPFAPRTS